MTWELHAGVHVKRDDLYTPIPGVNGGKARTCHALISRIHHAQTGVVTASSRSSPQALIVARLAAWYGLRCRVHTPTGTLGDELVLAAAAGAEIIQHRAGYNSVIVARARDDAAERGWPEIPFGMECQTAVDETRAEALRDPWPVDLRRLVVPVGSGMTLAGILAAHAHLDEVHATATGELTPLRVIGVCVGADPTKRLDRWAPPLWSWQAVELVQSGSDYHHAAGTLMLGGLRLDAHYEAKCLPFLEPGDGLWVVGERQSAREAVPA